VIHRNVAGLTRLLCDADVNRKDYRAWYGMGQTYELLGEPYYAINYYQKAAALRPNDSRMWAALAACYEKVKRYANAPPPPNPSSPLPHLGKAESR